MLKLEIKLDEQKVQAEGKYSSAAIYDALDRTFSKYRFRREVLADGTLCYYGNGLARDYGTFGRLITSLGSFVFFILWASLSASLGNSSRWMKKRQSSSGS